MTRIGVTGAEGLLGWHFSCHMLAHSKIEIARANRETFEHNSSLDDFVRNCDAIVHLAGMNRGSNDEIEHANPAIAQQLVDAMERVGVTPHVVYSSSTHIDRDTHYGRSKKNAGELLQDWSSRHTASYSNLVLPHVYGEQGRPFYNSVVSTFCHQVAHGEAPQIDNDGQLELLHAQQVSKIIIDAIQQKSVGTIRPPGKQMLVSELLAKLNSLASSYFDQVIPDLRDEFDLALFNTFRSYLFPAYYPVKLVKHTDDRGALFESVKTWHGGQAFLSSTRPGITRGNHFHYSKIERFLVVQGNAVIRLRRLFDSRVHEFTVSGDEPVYIDMPTLHTHNITNIGETDVLTFFWSHEIFNPNAPDTLHEMV